MGYWKTCLKLLLYRHTITSRAFLFYQFHFLHYNSPFAFNFYRVIYFFHLFSPVLHPCSPFVPFLSTLFTLCFSMSSLIVFWHFFTLFPLLFSFSFKSLYYLQLFCFFSWCHYILFLLHRTGFISLCLCSSSIISPPLHQLV